MSKLIDLTNQDFGYWHVIGRGPNNKDGRAQWLCHCTLCNKTTKLVQGGHLRAGRSKSCGCTKMEKMRQASIKNEVGKTYGYLQVQRQAELFEIPRRDSHGVYWVCDCVKCGRKNVVVKGDYLRNGDTQSCGCLRSKNEGIIANMLDSLGYKYKQQYTFSDLSSTERTCDKLMFDFGVLNAHTNELLYLIEYDGAQHFSETHAWDGFKYQTLCDNDDLKNDYCFNHHIPLIRIPYNKAYNLQDIKLETTRFLLTPDNEKEYYSQRSK